MEERIIDDEYGRGVRLKKTKDGYVDVTDELSEETENVEANEEMGEEVTFAFPLADMDEDDEDLVGLSPEEAMALRKKKEEERAKRKEDYARLCAEGENFLSEGSYSAAELKYEQALQLDELATEASVGYWRAKTANFTNPDALVGEYAKEGIDSMEYDLGIQATDLIRRDFHDVFTAKTAALVEEEKPLAEVVEAKQKARREVIRERVKSGTIALLCSAIPFVIALLVTAILGMKIPTTKDGSFIVPTVICGVVAFALFIVTLICFNKFFNAMRMRGKNEKLSSTEEGAKLLELRRYKKIYEYLAIYPLGEEEETKTAD